MRELLRKVYNYTKILLITFISGIIIGQYYCPIPLVKKTALPHFSGDALPDMDFSDDSFGYTMKDRKDMDKLVASSIKPKR